MAKEFLMLFIVMIIWSFGILVVIFLIDYFLSIGLLKYVLLIVGIFLIAMLGIRDEEAARENMAKHRENKIL